MEPLQIFQLASKQADWLSVRESVVASNIANANTPGFKTRDVTPFTDVLDKTAGSGDLQMVSTNPMHFGVGDETGLSGENIKVSSTGKTVGLAEEMMKAGEIRQSHDLNIGLVKSLNSMMLMAVKR